ncbi:MAG: TonB-dependent receptor [Methylococcaceae bacterium]|nr:TonB-dependent receptor [Methylococcaceae bacterium]
MVQAADTVITPATSIAKANRHSFNIGKQPLYSALNTLAEQGGVQFVFTEEMVKGLSSPGVSGQLSTEDALSQVLKGSGLGYRISRGNTITLEAKPVEAPSRSAEPTVLAPVKVSGEAVYDSTDPYNTAYNRSNASTATKTDTPIMETPMSIQVVTQQVMKDQQVVTVEDAIKNVSGVQRSWGYGNLYDEFYIRGFSTSDAGTYRNGFKMTTYAAETANVESIDILKGPAAMLYGRSDAGGMVNIVTKKPLDYAYYALQQQFGSYDFYRTTVDATGPINDDKSLLYRFNLAYTNADSFRDFNPTDRIFIAPSLTWRPTDATEVNLNFEYKNNDFVLDQGIPSLNGANRPADVPISRVYHEPDSNVHTDDYLVDLNWSHRFNDSWKLRNGFVATVQDYDLETIVAPFVRPDNQSLGRFANFADTERHSYGAFLDVTGQFDTFGVQHEVLVGTDWYEYSQSFSSSFRPTTDINIFNPVYGSVNFDQHRAFRDNDPNSFFKGDDEWFGIYFQDQITLWDKLHILGGGRHDWVRSKTGSSDLSTAAINQAIVDTERFQPRVGIVYQPWNWLSVYGNFVESLGSNNGISGTGEALKPEIAEQFEAGIKAEWFDGRLSSTLAYYNIEKQNIRTADLSTPVLFDQVAIGMARSQGIELDVKGQITDNLSLIGTYAFTDARIIKNNDGDEGNRLPNVPENSGSLWAKYDFNGTPLDGFSFGSGVYVAGQREGDNANTLQLPGYGRWDAMAAYRFKVGKKARLTTQLNVNNILDKQYYKNTDTLDGNPRGRISVGEPLTLMGSIKLEY